jgi:hypothetical protein
LAGTCCWVEADFLAKDKVTHAYTPVVINTGSKLVAIDTGLGLGMFEQSKGAVGQYRFRWRLHRQQGFGVKGRS